MVFIPKYRQSDRVHKRLNKNDTFESNSSNVVFYENRDAVERTPGSVEQALVIQHDGLVKRGGVCLNYSTQYRSLKVNFLNPGKIRLYLFVNQPQGRHSHPYFCMSEQTHERTYLDQIYAVELARGQSGLKFRQRRFVKIR